MRQLETYTYTIATGETITLPAANDNFIILAATGSVTVRGDTFGTLKNLVAGQGLKMVPFNRLELVNTSGAPNTVSILLTPAEFVNQVFSGSVSVVGDLGLNVATINSLIRPEPSNGNFANIAALVGNTPLTVFTPAANVNGAVLLSADISAVDTSLGAQAFIAKSSAPTSITDGEVLLVTKTILASTNTVIGAVLPKEQFIAAGLGLYFLASSAAAANGSSIRAARYRLL